MTSENVRVALFGMEALNKQIQETEFNLNTIQAELDNANQQRQKTVAELEKVTAAYEKANQDIAQSQEQIRALEAVSYTHLDVYKRQAVAVQDNNTLRGKTLTMYLEEKPASQSNQSEFCLLYTS